LRTKKTLAEMQTGEVLKLKATDSGATHDIPAFCKQTGNELIATDNEGDTMVFYVKRR